MLFTSYEFIFFVIFVCAIYYIIPKNYQWKLLLVASFVFYGYAGIKYLLYICATICSVYFVSRKLDSITNTQENYLNSNKGSLSKSDQKNYKAKIKSKRWKWLLFCLFFNFGILAVIKYADFTVANVNSFFNFIGEGGRIDYFNFVLPLGISFYTFQTMSYIIDLYRGKCTAEKNIMKLALFVSFFPQVIQGPISRFEDLKKTLFSHHKFNGRNISFGVQRILLGFFKKLVIADRLVIAVKEIVGNTAEYQGAYVLIGMLFYAITLYADFTGGIDITIGIAEVLGIKVKENFNRPFYSKSIAEYWRRWHITMGTWFKDYLFYPISVCKPMLKFARFSRTRLGEGIGKRVPVYVSTITVWFMTGLWHGASWNFIVWGLMNGVVIIISQEFTPLYAKFHQRFKFGESIGYDVFQIVRTFWLMSFIRILDCYRDVGTTFKMYGTIFTNFSIEKLNSSLFGALGLTIADYAVVVAGVAVLLVISFFQRKGEDVREILSRSPVLLRYGIFAIVFISVTIFGIYGVGYDSNQFIYNQF